MVLFCYLCSMKHTSKKYSLLLCWLGVIGLLAVFVGTVNAIQIWWKTVEIPSSIQHHTSRLHSLFVWNGWLIATEDRLNISNWLILGNGSSNSSKTTIAWGLTNKIWSNSSNSWIAWWQNNEVSGSNSVIGWGIGNKIGEWDGFANKAVIAWGEGNQILPPTTDVITDPSVVVWWYANKSQNWWTVLGGAGNTAKWANNLVLWQNAKWDNWSFAWNWEAKQFSAYIWAENWILIGTNERKDGINLVINWAMKIWWDNTAAAVAWEMRVVNGCFYAYDWEYRHVITQSAAEDNCDDFENISKQCLFGNVWLETWDKAEAYPERVASNCGTPQEVVCGADWKLRKTGSTSTERYAYCYDSRSSWSYGTITIWDITIMDRNLWAISNNINSSDSYGYKYQRWNNYWFLDSDTPTVTTAWLTWNSSYDNHGYYSTERINWASHYNDVWYGEHENHRWLRWWASDWSSNNRWLDTISSTAINRQWPCPSGWHVPSAWEWSKLLEYWAADYTSNQWWSVSIKTDNLKYFESNSTAREAFQTYFKLPFAGTRGANGDIGSAQGAIGYYWSSSPYSSSHTNGSYMLYLNSSSVDAHNDGYRSSGFSVRCFKNK